MPDLVIDIPQAATNGPPLYDFGPGFHAALRDRMTQSGKYIVVEPRSSLALSLQSPREADGCGPLPDQWNSGELLPAGRIKIEVDTLGFVTGARGDRMFYGFNERMRNPFNDGYGKYPNEFPLRENGVEPTWFDRAFDDRGTSPFDARSGLDLGQGFDVNALVAFLDVKYALYRSQMRMRVELDAPLAGRHEVRAVSVKGSGYYWDIVGGYANWSGGIGLARRNAMDKAFKAAFAASYGAIEHLIGELPFTARINRARSAEKIYLDTGPDSAIAAGTIFASVDEQGGETGNYLKVLCSVPSGSIARLVRGDLAALRPGLALKQVSAVPTSFLPESLASFLAMAHSYSQARALVPAASATPVPPPTPVLSQESIVLPSNQLPRADLQGQGPRASYWQAALKSAIETPFLPYRIWRYFNYDQDMHGKPASHAEPVLQTPSSAPPTANLGASDAFTWSEQARKEPWARQIGLDRAGAQPEPDPQASPVVVAVIDSGIDYNHIVLHDSIWSNPEPVTDADGFSDRYGWDFISGDPRPFDDGYHGTEVASMVLAVAPYAHLMPLKVFNPFGITSSAAIYGAFQYAVDHGAQIILCGWATRKPSRTIELAVEYARAHGVLVVAAAGDRGEDLERIATYPAALSARYDNIITVTGVDTADRLVTINHFFANFDPKTVTIAAPGQKLRVADPRQGSSRQTSTALAAGLVAGALARQEAFGKSGDYTAVKAALLQAAEPVPALAGAVNGGLRLRIAR